MGPRMNPRSTESTRLGDGILELSWIAEGLRSGMACEAPIDKQIRWTYEDYFNLRVIIMWTLITYHILNTILTILNLIMGFVTFCHILSHTKHISRYGHLGDDWPWKFGVPFRQSLYLSGPSFTGHQVIIQVIGPQLPLSYMSYRRFTNYKSWQKRHPKIIHGNSRDVRISPNISRYIQLIHMIDAFVLRNLNRHVPSGNLT
jgi:hypothetical protein